MNLEYVNRTIRFIVVIACIFIAAFSFYFIWKVAYPFIIAIVIALMINPFVNWVEHKGRLPRTWAVVVSLTLIVSVFVGLITLLIAEIVSGANYLSNEVPNHVETIVKYIEDFIISNVIPLYHQIAGLFKSLDSGQQNTILQSIETAGSKIATSAGEFLQDFFQKLPELISWIPNAATVLVFATLATFFISKDWNKLTKKAEKYIPGKAISSGEKVFIDLKKALFGFIRAQFTLISITAVIVLVGLLILRVDYAITIALVSGLVDILPYLGTGAVFVPWIAYEFITGNINLGIGLSVLYLIVVVQRQIMEPKVLSSSIGLDPLATLVALFVGFKLMGFLGLIIGPVSLVILTTLKRAGVFEDIWRFIKGTTP